MSDRLIVIDDQADFASFVRKVAERVGYEVRTTTQPAEFRQWLREWSPTLIILDLVMPEVDGVEILRFLAEEHCTATIFIMSGFDHRVLDAARRLGLERGLNIAATLEKPLRAKELTTLLELHKVAPSAEITVDALHEAIGKGDIQPFYQPKVNLRSWQPMGFEALVRWRHAKRGVISPDEFVPMAEASGSIDDLSKAVAGSAMAQLATWLHTGMDLKMSINLSGRNLHEVTLADRLSSMCRQAGVPEDHITFEVTETAAMADPVRALDILTRLRIKGFELSIDDFGTGYSSLVQLHRLPFSELKIDQSFVRECDRSREARVIVKAIIELAHNLEMFTVAEGAETEDVVHVLEDMGCDAVQGYAFARPMGADRVPAWLEEWSGGAMQRH
ncbi:MAG TPA: EAL domain-containing response regulator [Magnetospirillum sp.]|nr:EAL domain-containing response regulator [Magnetospirillum sp.]